MKFKYGLSVILPAYNEEKVIKNCLNSVFKIKKLKLEVIVVDDGSKDSTSDIVSNYPCKLIKNKKNLGAALSKNKAIKLAKFNYILIIDANSIIKQGAIEKMFFYLKSNKNLSGINGMWNFKTPSSSFFSKVQALDTHFQIKIIKKEKFSFYWGNGSIIKKKIFLRTGGFSSYYKKAGCEDYEIIFRMNNNKKFFIPGIISIDHHFPNFFFNGLKKYIFRTALFIQTYLFYKNKVNSNDNWHTTNKNFISLLFSYLFIFSVVAGLFINKFIYIISLISLLLLIITNFEKIKFIRKKTSIFFVLFYIVTSLTMYLLIGFGIVFGVIRFLVSNNEFKKYN